MDYYTYLWLREDGTPYYVGKGCGKRAFERSGHTCLPPKDKNRILLQDFPDETSAFAAEVFLIAHYGRLDLGTGCLRNAVRNFCKEIINEHTEHAEFVNRSDLDRSETRTFLDSKA
jgi:hypothetical protein